MLNFFFYRLLQKKVNLIVENFSITTITPCHSCHVSSIFLAHSHESYINICVGIMFDVTITIIVTTNYDVEKDMRRFSLNKMICV
jgi:hypothetical protein